MEYYCSCRHAKLEHQALQASREAGLAPNTQTHICTGRQMRAKIYTNTKKTQKHKYKTHAHARTDKRNKQDVDKDIL